ncbi:hypothetical protein V8F20_004445 [Naviculisporaceae sp. PSN 640]
MNDLVNIGSPPTQSQETESNREDEPRNKEAQRQDDQLEGPRTGDDKSGFQPHFRPDAVNGDSYGYWDTKHRDGGLRRCRGGVHVSWPEPRQSMTSGERDVPVAVLPSTPFSGVVEARQVLLHTCRYRTGFFIQINVVWRSVKGESGTRPRAAPQRANQGPESSPCAASAGRRIPQALGGQRNGSGRWWYGGRTDAVNVEYSCTPASAGGAVTEAWPAVFQCTGPHLHM